MIHKIFRVLTPFLFGFSLFLLSDSLAARTIYVRSGADAAIGKGSQEKPFATLEAARDFLRTLPKTESHEVVVEGTFTIDQSFELTQEDSGTKEFPILWIGKGARLRGAQEIDPNLFQPVTDETLLERMDANSRGKILALDLNSLGIAPLDPPAERMSFPLPVPELFVGDKRMTIAQWPNGDWEWETIQEYVAPKMNMETGEKPADPTRFVYDDPKGENRPTRWSKAPEIYLHGFWQFDWLCEVMKVDRILPEQKEIDLVLQHSAAMGYINPAPRRWKVVNLLEELDRPGEYCYDQKENRLFFWFPAEAATEPILLDTKDRNLLKMENVSDVTFRGFTFSESYTIAVRSEFCTRITFDHCVVCNIRQSAFWLGKGVENTVSRSLIEETGTGGVFLSGGNRQTLTPCHSKVENCVIHRFAVYQPCYAMAVYLWGVGMEAAHNEIYDSPHMAIGMGTNNSIFEYNIVHDICWGCDDCGALYKGQDPTLRGNHYRYNFWYDIGCERGHGNTAIYFDDGDCGERVYGNIFLRAGDPGMKGEFGAIFSHGGNQHYAWNNIFIDCKKSIGSAPWDDERWKKAVQNWTPGLTEFVDIRVFPYIEQYPELANFLEAPPEAQRRSYAARNLIIGEKVPIGGNWNVEESNWITEERDFFVDPDGMNFKLKPDAKVFEKIPEFKDIPFEQMGVQPE